MDLKVLKSKTAELVIPVDDDALHVQYRPHAILTRDVMQDAQTPEEMIDMASRAIASWDLELDGVPIETTAQGLREVPIDVLTDVMRQITQAINPGTNGSRSSAT